MLTTLRDGLTTALRPTPRQVNPSTPAAKKFTARCSSESIFFSPSDALPRAMEPSI